MSDAGYWKCACQKCGGHLEFPPASAGETIACPHCGEPTTLVANDSTSAATGKNPATTGRNILIIISATLILALIAAGIFFLSQKTSPSVAPPVVQPARPMPTNPVVRTDFSRLNDFNVGPVTLKKTEGSGLVYAVGIVQNDSDRQRFGVRIQLDVLDAADNKIGTASDYLSVLEPHKEWPFRALLTEPKAVKAKPVAIDEQK